MGYFFSKKETEEHLLKSKIRLLGTNAVNSIKDSAIFATQENMQSAIDISTPSVEVLHSTSTEPVTKDILDTIIEWVSTPTSSPKKDAENLNQLEKTTLIDTNNFVMDEEDITKNDKNIPHEQENSMKLITPKVLFL